MIIKDKDNFYDLYCEKAIARDEATVSREDFDNLLMLIEPCINEYKAEKMIEEYRPCMNYSDEYLCNLDDTPEVIAEREKRNLVKMGGHWYCPIEKRSKKMCLCFFEYKNVGKELLELEYLTWRDKWRFEMAGEGWSYNAGAEHEADYRMKRIAEYIGYCVLEEDGI